MTVETIQHKIERIGRITQEELKQIEESGTMLQTLCAGLDPDNKFDCKGCPFRTLCATTVDEFYEKMKEWFNRRYPNETIRIEME